MHDTTILPIVVTISACHPVLNSQRASPDFSLHIHQPTPGRLLKLSTLFFLSHNEAKDDVDDEIAGGVGGAEASGVYSRMENMSAGRGGPGGGGGGRTGSYSASFR
jgi:hypothetical protein